MGVTAIPKAPMPDRMFNAWLQWSPHDWTAKHLVIVTVTALSDLVSCVAVTEIRVRVVCFTLFRLRSHILPEGLHVSCHLLYVDRITDHLRDPHILRNLRMYSLHMQYRVNMWAASFIKLYFSRIHSASLIIPLSIKIGR